MEKSIFPVFIEKISVAGIENISVAGSEKTQTEKTPRTARTATTTDESMSGTDVPAARNVRPA